jgi:hypothetical protein
MQRTMQPRRPPPPHASRRRTEGARRNARPTESTGSSRKEYGALAQEPKRSCGKMTNQPHQPKTPVHRKSRQEKVWGAKNLQAFSRASNDSRPGVEVERRKLRAGPRELGSVAGAWRWTGPLAAWPPQGEARRGRGTTARGSFFRYFFCFSLGSHQPDTTVSTARQVAAGCRRFDFDPPLPPTPSGRVHALTPIFLRARARVRVRLRSLAWLEMPPAQLGWVAAGLGRHEEDGSGLCSVFDSRAPELLRALNAHGSNSFVFSKNYLNFD